MRPNLKKIKQNFQLVIEYDGTRYYGWQIQKSEPTIQGELEKALYIITNENISIIGSGRTDARVHALAQVANFRCQSRLSPINFQNAFNSLLPGDIVINSCKEVPLDFHSRFDAKSKIYLYKILNRHVASALMRHYVWHVPRKLNLDAMREGGQFFEGNHDFKSFEGAGSPRHTTVRNISRLDILVKDNQEIYVEIEANGFLRHMVRNIVGTLVEIGLGKYLPNAIPKIISDKDRSLAGATAPPQGLYLTQVNYDGIVKSPTSALDCIL